MYHLLLASQNGEFYMTSSGKNVFQKEPTERRLLFNFGHAYTRTCTICNYAFMSKFLHI
jgi:hypothetical protein